MSNNHVNQIRDQFTRQAQAYADTAQAKDDAAHVRFDSGDATELPYADGEFDVVMCRAAFHHFPNPSRVLGEMRRVAKQGGKVMVADFVTSPNAQFARAHNAIERLCDPTHVRALPADQLRALFIDKELEVVEDRPGRMHYGLTDWLAHGGPASEAEQEIRRRFAEALVSDETGLEVRRDGDETCFTHQTLVLVGRR